MQLLKAMQISASGMSLDRMRLQIVAGNIANANSTRTPDNQGPYRRRLMMIETQPFDRVYQDAIGHDDGPSVDIPQLVGIVQDTSPGPTIFDPGHPDADPNGYVTMPNVNIVEEMVDMMSASRSYEANLNALEASRDMALKALEIGR